MKWFFVASILLWWATAVGADFVMDQKTLPDVHVWEGDQFSLYLAELPVSQLPKGGNTTWYREIAWKPDTHMLENWAQLGVSSSLEGPNSTDCTHLSYPTLSIANCDAQQLRFDTAIFGGNDGRFLALFMSPEMHLYFYLRVVVHEAPTVLVPVWYGSYKPRDHGYLHYNTHLRFQCHSLTGNTEGLVTYSQVKNHNQGDIRGWESNRTLLAGPGFHFWDKPTQPHRFEARCCVRGSVVGLDDRCGDWVRIDLQSKDQLYRGWCPRFTGNYQLTKDLLADRDASVVSKCRRPVAKLHGRMKNRVCEGQRVDYQPLYEATGWFRAPIPSPVMNRMLNFTGDSGSRVDRNHLTVFNMSRRYEDWYMYTNKMTHEAFVELAMEPKLRVFIRLVELDSKSFSVQCVTNLDGYGSYAAPRVWWEIKSSVHAIKKVDSRTLYVEPDCANSISMFNFLFHLRCHASTSLQTGVSEWFSGNGWKTLHHPPAWHFDLSSFLSCCAG